MKLNCKEISTPQGRYLLMSPGDRIQNRLQQCGEWEPISSIITTAYCSARLAQSDAPPPSLCIVDFGANIGTFSIHVARAFAENVRVFAVECQPRVFAQLSANILLNELVNVTPIMVGVGECDEVSEIEMVDVDRTADSGVFSIAKKTDVVFDGKVKVFFAEAARILKLVKPAAIKIDLEGFDGVVVDHLINENLTDTLIIAETLRDEQVSELIRRGYSVWQYKDLFVCYPRGSDESHRRLNLKVVLEQRGL